MAWSRRRTWFVLTPVVLVLAAFAAMRLQPVSRIRDAYDQIRVGMNIVQVAAVLERCGCDKYRKPGRLTGGDDPVADAYLSPFALSGVEIDTVLAPLYMLTYRGADGEVLTIRWRTPQGLMVEGHVVGKEYHSGIEMKLRGLWERLRQMLQW